MVGRQSESISIFYCVRFLDEKLMTVCVLQFLQQRMSPTFPCTISRQGNFRILSSSLTHYICPQPLKYAHKLALKHHLFREAHTFSRTSLLAQIIPAEKYSDIFGPYIFLSFFLFQQTAFSVASETGQRHFYLQKTNEWSHMLYGKILVVMLVFKGTQGAT